MAYCRYGDNSDIYFHESSAGGFECMRCSFAAGENKKLFGFDEAIAHLKAHREAGDLVPEKALTELFSDRDAARKEH